MEYVIEKYNLIWGLIGLLPKKTQHFFMQQMMNAASVVRPWRQTLS